MRYEDFLRAKVAAAPTRGQQVDVGDVSPVLLPHQRAIVPWMVRGGRRALFAAFGLGKTLMQLEAVRLAREAIGGRGLIVIPLGVRQEFFRDAALLGTPVRFIRSIEEAAEPVPGWDGNPNAVINLTNYETVRDGKLDPHHFTVTSLDEAAVLRGFGGTKTFREFMRLFADDDRSGPAGPGIPFRFVATATPSPNDYIELLAYAAYLSIMDVGEAKTRFFKRNSEKADTLTIHPHKQAEFWLWVASWALFVQKPSDICEHVALRKAAAANGDTLVPCRCDAGYELPPLDVRWHELPSDHANAGSERDGQRRLYCNAALGVTDAAREKRHSLRTRLDRLLEIIGDGLHGPGEEEGVLQGVLPAEQGEVPGALGRAAQAAAADLEGVSSSLPGGKPGPAERQAQGALQDGPGVPAPSSGPQPGGAPPEARPDAGGLAGHPRRAGRRLRDLREEPAGHEDGGGPRPQDGPGARPSVRELQQGVGHVQRPAGSGGGGGRLPDQVVVWCDLNSEQRAIELALHDRGISYSSLYGSLSLEERERRLEAWRRRETVVLIGKAVLIGSGVNLQQSNRAIFIGIGFKFAEFIQACHRQHRFLQKRQVRIDLIYTEAESAVRRSLETKWRQHVELVDRMAGLIREYGLGEAALAGAFTRSIEVERVEVTGTGWSMVNADSIDEAKSIESDSVGLIVTSIPFGTQYEYSASYRDLGHTDDDEHFFRHLGYLTPELLRATMPGRVAAIHVKDRITPGGLTGLGFQTVTPFSDATVAHFRAHGWAFLGRKTVVTDVVRENNQTYRLGYTEQCKDGSRMGAGMPEYVLLFRKPPTDRSNGYADLPVVKSKAEYSRSRWQIDAHGYMRSSGNRPLAAEDLDGLTHAQIFRLFRRYSQTSVYDFERHVALGEHLDAKGLLPVTFMLLPPQSWHPDVWTDVARMRTFNNAQAAKGREMHLCPLQFDIVDRLITQFSQPGELVLDPFAGLGTTVARAVRLKRRGLGWELSARYFGDACGYCEAASRELATPSLLDLMAVEDEDLEPAAAGAEAAS